MKFLRSCMASISAVTKGSSCRELSSFTKENVLEVLNPRTIAIKRGKLP